MNNIFEAMMLVCFGAAWPLAIYKTWRSKQTGGKSLFFLIVILIGYVSGVIHKLINDPDLVIFLYIFNGLMVAIDIALFIHYRKDEQARRPALQNTVQ